MRNFQYNKAELLNLDKELKARLNALPILKSKEAALRAAVARLRLKLQELRDQMEARKKALVSIQRLWCEFPDLVRIKKIHWQKENFASVKVQVIKDVEFEVDSFDILTWPSWFFSGIEVLKEFKKRQLEYRVQKKILETLEHARRKTTQKVNLYEKVQIPAYREAILKIKRFLEDVETISKSSQKILKRRLEEVLEVAA